MAARRLNTALWTRRQVLATGAAASAIPATGAVALAQEPTVRIERTTLGPGLARFGLNFAHYFPGSNTTQWVRYMRINCARNFTNPNPWIRPEDLDDGADITDLDSFEAARAELRANPENNRFINWPPIVDAYANVVHEPTNFYVVNHLFAETAKHNVEMLVEMDVKDGWLDGWSGLWRNWQLCYAHAYYLAKNFGVRRFSFCNEPDVPRVAEQFPTIPDYIRALRFATDAIRCAVEDAGRAIGQPARAIVHAPVITRSAMTSNHSGHPEDGPYAGEQNIELNLATTGYYGNDTRDDEIGWGRAALESLRIDYRGEEVDYAIFDVWDTHSYMRTPDYYPVELEIIRRKLDELTPEGVDLPVMYTELNRFNNWGYGQTARTVDTPEIAREIGAIAANSTQAGVDGLYFFKFAGARDPETGEVQGVGFLYVDHNEPYDIRGASRSAESLRLFAKGFTGSAELRAVTTDGMPTDFEAWASYDPGTRRHHLLMRKHNSGTVQYQLDLSALEPGVRAGAPVTVEEISATHAGGIAQQWTVPESKVLSVRQPGWNMWMLTIPDASVRELPPLVAHRNALVRSGADADTNFGDRSGLAVQRLDGGHEVTYLGFNVDARGSRVSLATLEVVANVPDGAEDCTVMVFAIPGWKWDESTLTWNTAPYLAADDSILVGAGDAAVPAGQLTVTESRGPIGIDVTDIVREQPPGPLTFCLIKQPRFEADDDQNGRRVLLVSRHDPDVAARPRLRRWA